MKNLLLLLCFFIGMTCRAQLPPGQYTTTNKKAISLLEEGLKLFNAHNDEKAKETLLKAIEKAPEFIEPHLVLAEIYYSNRQTQQAIDEYKKGIAINPKFSLDNFYNLAQLEMAVGKYEDAKADFEQFLKKAHMNPDSKENAERQLENCKFAINAIKNPVPFEPKNMGPSINSQYYEYFPAITADDQTFLFTRNLRGTGGDAQEDFLFSKKINGEWQPAKMMGSGINSNENEGAPSLSADGQILFFTVCPMIQGYGNDRKGFGACDIFYSEKVGENWSKALNVGQAINSKFRETQPSFSSDGKSLYFVSNRPGGLGAHDIYVSVLKDDGSWAAPKNLGSKVNTAGDEQSVFIHPDGRTLYFGSNGHTGMGGFDIYVSRMSPAGEWQIPVNLGYPINTYSDEHSLLVNGAGDLAYFASERPGGFGGLDMYQFPLYEAARPEKITYMKGKVYDAKTKAPLAAHFELIDLETAKPVMSSDANSGNGEFLVVLPIDKNYALNVTQPGYLFYSENFSLKSRNDVTQPFMMDVPLQPIDTGSIVELKNVFFETAKFDLKPESKAELDKLVNFLTINKTMRIELDGHTDNVGDKKSNQLLSQNRAKAVYDYLVVNGIDLKRLSFKGFGDTRPKVKNDSDANRAINRRTEFKVVGK